MHKCVRYFQIKHLSIEYVLSVWLLDDTPICVLLNPCLILYNGLFCAFINGNGNFNGSYGTWNTKVPPCKLYENKHHIKEKKRYTNETTISKTKTNEEIVCFGFLWASCVHDVVVSHCVFWIFSLPSLFSCIYLTAECANYLDDFTFFIVQNKREKTNTCKLVNKPKGLHYMKYGNS